MLLVGPGTVKIWSQRKKGRGYVSALCSKKYLKFLPNPD